MDWYIVCALPQKAEIISSFPLSVGREPTGGPCVVFSDLGISRRQFALNRIMGQVYYVNKAPDNPALLDGVAVSEKKHLTPGVHIVRCGSTVIGIGTNYEKLAQAVSEQTDTFFMARAGGRDLGPWTDEQLLEACENGVLGRDSKVWYAQTPDDVREASEFVEFGQPAVSPAASAAADQVQQKRFATVDEGARAILGETFQCPYCRAVCDIGDVLAVAVSPTLLGDAVLGEGEPSRFSPVSFTDSGLAIDAEGGICTDVACPRCHMSFPNDLMKMRQLVMSVVGTSGAGKSVFLASAIWQCRKVLKAKFDVGFRDLDPLWNTWIRGYEEKLFFQQDDTQIQQIEKTDIQSTKISRLAKLGGGQVMLPTPSFFRIDGRTAEDERCLAVYDCAGEHFLPGADKQASLVTLHTLSADTVLFLYDPTADPRLRDLLEYGGGTAHNYAQMQDVLLAELAAKAKRHMGVLGATKLRQPLLFSISKADLLRSHLPMETEVYRQDADGRLALDVAALRHVSDETEKFLSIHAPEVVGLAHDVSDAVWFLPTSALGHNPMNEGVRPCDIRPQWAELPVVMTLARLGYVATVNGTMGGVKP